MMVESAQKGGRDTSPARRILIVDDTPENLAVLAQVLRQEGYEVVTSLNGRRALQVAGRTPPDLVLLDIRMPEMDGYEVCRRFKADASLAGIPVIFISAATDTEVKVRAFTSGGVDFVSKPFEAEEVLARVRTHLALRAVEDELARRLDERTRELRTSEARYRTLVEALHADYFFYTRAPDGQIVYVSQAVSGVLGYTPAEFRDRCHDILQPSPPAPEAGAVPTAAGSAPLQFEARHRNGESRTLEVSEYPVPDASGGVVSFEGIAHDVTAQRRTQAELLKAKEAAEAASRAKTAFLAMMGHEVRTPIAGVLGMADLLRGAAFTPTQASYVDALVISARNLLTVVTDILDMAAMDSGTLVLDIIPFDLARVAGEMYSLTRDDAEGKGLSLDLITDPRPLPQVLGDPSKVRRVIQSLIGNAIKFTETGGIHLRVSRLEAPGLPPEALVEVVDTGIGIAPQDYDRLFQPFSQVDSSLSRRYGGTGLGLASAQHLVRMMGGNIGFDSIPGQGSRFWFTLPFQS